jgi:hypothetical protein
MLGIGGGQPLGPELFGTLLVQVGAVSRSLLFFGDANFAIAIIDFARGGTSRRAEIRSRRNQVLQ